MPSNRQGAAARSNGRHQNWKKKKALKKEQEKYYTKYVDLVQQLQQEPVNFPINNINRQLSACSIETTNGPTYNSYIDVPLINHPVGNIKISQVEVRAEDLIEKYVGSPGKFFAKKELGTSTAGLLERRNVLVETPSSIFDHPNGIGNGNGGAVPLSPNTRRMAFNFTPISPRLTPDIPPSPGSAGQPLHLRQLLSTQGGGTSPLVAPGQTSAPSSFPPSQPHLGHNSGHFMMNMDTPASFVTESISDRNDSAYVSPLTTSVNRSRNKSPYNLLVNRVRDSAVALNSVRHMPYAKPSLMNHGQDVLFNVSDRSHHSSGGQSKKEKKRKVDKRLPEQRFQPSFYYKPMPSMSVPAVVQSTSTLVGNLCRLASTERRLITRSESSTAESPVVPLCNCSTCRARSALHSKKVSIFRKPEIAISNAPTRFQPTYQTYFALAGIEINDGADSRDKSDAVDGSINNHKNSNKSRSSRPNSRDKSDAVDGSINNHKNSNKSRSSRPNSRDKSDAVDGSINNHKNSNKSRSSRPNSRDKSDAVDGSINNHKNSNKSCSSRPNSRDKSDAVDGVFPEEGDFNSSLDLSEWLDVAESEQILNSLKNFPLDIDDIDL